MKIQGRYIKIKIKKKTRIKGEINFSSFWDPQKPKTKMKDTEFTQPNDPFPMNSALPPPPTHPPTHPDFLNLG